MADDYPDPRTLEPDPRDVALRECIAALRTVQPLIALSPKRADYEAVAVQAEVALEVVAMRERYGKSCVAVKRGDGT